MTGPTRGLQSSRAQDEEGRRCSAHLPCATSPTLQVFIDAPNAASGPIPDDVSPFFAGPYFEW